MEKMLQTNQIFHSKDCKIEFQRTSDAINAGPYRENIMGCDLFNTYSIDSILHPFEIVIPTRN